MFILLSLVRAKLAQLIEFSYIFLWNYPVSFWLNIDLYTILFIDHSFSVDFVKGKMKNQTNPKLHLLYKGQRCLSKRT